MTNLVRTSPHAEIVTLTRNLVDDLLALNTRNRKVRPAIVAHYRRMIERGEWVTTNQGIGVSASGILIDGQHRLEAIRQAGYPPLKVLLMTGMPDEAVGAVDVGAVRTAGDYLRIMHGIHTTGRVAAIVRTSLAASSDFTISHKYSSKEYEARFLYLREGIEAVCGVYGLHNLLPAAVLAALVDAYAFGFKAESVGFTEAVVSGESLSKNNPALTMRNWVLLNRGRAGGANMTAERYRKTMRAFAAWVLGEDLPRLHAMRIDLSQLARVKNAKRSL